MKLLRMAAVVAGLLSVTSMMAQRAPAQGAPPQSPQSSAKPAFEAASVKRNTTPGQPISKRLQLADRYLVTNDSLSDVIVFAYEIHPRHLVGMPAWMASQRFDISAKADHEVTDTEKRAMVRTLLETRFNLVVRVEVREETVYELVVARSDGRLGPNIQPTSAGCLALIKSGARMAPLEKGDPCGGAFPDIASANLRFFAMEMPAFARNLSGLYSETIVDRTGLTGMFDVAMKASIADRSVNQPFPAQWDPKLGIHVT